MDQDLYALSALIHAFTSRPFSRHLYTPLGRFAMGELLSLGFLLLLTISKRGPSAGFRGEVFSAFSYSVILSLGGGEGDATRFNPSVSTVPTVFSTSERVASRAKPRGCGPGSPRSSPE